jgi:predicted TIM-barrel fold metal-dependent hydrolase
MLIADAHVHLFDPLAAKNPEDWAITHKEPHWGQLVCKGPQGWADVGQLITKMDEARIDWVVLTGWYWQNSQSATAENTLHHRAEKLHPGRFRRFAPLVPDPSGNFLHQAQNLWDTGVAGFGEFLPQVQGFSLKDPHWLKFSNWASEVGAPLLFHVTEPAGHRYNGRVDTPLIDTLDYLETFPDLKVILAHWGGGLPFYSLNHRVKSAMRNVWVDTAASPLLYHARIWDCVPMFFDPARILYGSDFPLKTYPGRSNQPNFTDLISEIRNSQLSQDQLTAILGQNLINLIGKPS